MFKIISYKTRWTKKHGVPVTLPKPFAHKVIAQFPTLGEARSFIAGKDKTVIEYPKSYIKEISA